MLATTRLGPAPGNYALCQNALIAPGANVLLSCRQAKSAFGWYANLSLNNSQHFQPVSPYYAPRRDHEHLGLDRSGRRVALHQPRRRLLCWGHTRKRSTESRHSASPALEKRGPFLSRKPSDWIDPVLRYLRVSISNDVHLHVDIGFVFSIGVGVDVDVEVIVGSDNSIEANVDLNFDSDIGIDVSVGVGIDIKADI
ncbi:unnamed protein product [Protopolystoma xenopodis]|uniref:Uncharacterized protein n=1 Tax=Protopolystoma xenopodis TaxID=117903 RepID=A0A448XLZ5_9PLAT|nr:unnamed protein product [Protopolystoma xenopodis]